MFSRYLPALSRRAAGVTVEAPIALVPLLRAMPGAGQVVAFDPTLPLPPRERDVEIMELGHALRADAEWSEPYLAAEPLADVPRGAVGLCWQAGHWDPRRSVPEQALRAATAAARCVAIPRPDDGAHADATMTARLLASLDLVVTVDTMIAHLAGALGRTTWLLLRAEADWRWMRGDTSPWYPRMRIFRQRTEGDWSAPLAAVAEALRRRAAG